MIQKSLRHILSYLFVLFVLATAYQTKAVANVFNSSDDPCNNLVASWTIDILNAVPLFYKLPRRLSTNERYLTVDNANKLIEQAKDNELKSFVQEILLPKQIQTENIPINRNSSSRDSIFFTGLRCPIKTEIIFINPSTEELTATINCGNDEVTCAAMEAERNYGLGERRKKYLVETIAASLTNSSTFKVAGEKLKTQDLPNGMVKFVQKEFDSLINQLPSGNKKKLNKVRISVSNADNELWLKSSTTDNTITLSPALLRAIFVLVVKDNCPRCIFFSNDDELTDAFNKVSQEHIFERFRKELHFILGHEIGHFLKNNAGIFGEELEKSCDDVGAELAMKLDKQLSLRVFSVLVVQGIKEDSKLWGVELRSDVSSVKTRMDELRKKYQDKLDDLTKYDIN